MLGSRLSTMAMVLASFLASTSDLVDCCCHNCWVSVSLAAHLHTGSY